jgi:hypothetical protein
VLLASRTLIAALLAVGQAQAASGTFTAAVDRTELYQNEHVVLTLSLADSDTRLRAEGVKPNIDLTLLTDQFELGVPRTDFRFNMAREERRSTSELTVELFPKRSGRLTVPAFAVDGLRTEPIALQVLPLPADARPRYLPAAALPDRTSTSASRPCSTSICTTAPVWPRPSSAPRSRPSRCRSRSMPCRPRNAARGSAAWGTT